MRREIPASFGKFPHNGFVTVVSLSLNVIIIGSSEQLGHESAISRGLVWPI